MFIRNLKNKMSKKFTKKMIIIFLSILILIFLMLKNEFFFNAINYVAKYFDYYKDKYLNGIFNNLYLGGYLSIYIEGDLQNIISGIYLYGVTFSNVLYPIFMVIVSLIIFSRVSNEYFCELHKKSSSSKIIRIGLDKYVNNTIISNSVYYGLIIMLPKILYFILLLIFFPIGSTLTHYINSATYLEADAFLYQTYLTNPYILIVYDLVLSFIYGVIIYYISLIVVSLSKKQSMSYFVFIFTLAILSIIASKTGQVPIVFWHSFFSYYSQVTQKTIGISSEFSPVIFTLILSIIIGISTKFIYKKAVENTI